MFWGNDVVREHVWGLIEIKVWYRIQTSITILTVDPPNVYYNTMHVAPLDAFTACSCTYLLSQQGAAGIQHEGMGEEDFTAVHLQLHITQLWVVHHGAQV